MDKHHIFGSYQEFILFLLIHVGNSDYSLKGSEIEVILSKMEDYFPEIDDMDILRSKFVSLKDEYDELSDTSINHLIYHNYLSYKNDSINADRIVNDLQEVIMADGFIHDQETKTMETIKKLLNIREHYN